MPPEEIPPPGGTMRRLAALAIAVMAGSALSLTSFAGAGAATGRTTLPGSIPAWANSKSYAGPATANGDVGFRVYLGWNDPSGVLALARAVSDPRSASYGDYLTPAQFRARFAPSQAQVEAVQSWLRGAGFSVEYTPQNNHYVSADGTIAPAEAPSGTSFGMHKAPGLSVRSPSSDLSLPPSRPVGHGRQPAQPGGGPGHLPPPGARPEAGPAGLVRGGDPGRRGRAWHGTGGAHRVCRRAEQFPGPRRGPQLRRGQARRTDRQQLLRLQHRDPAARLHPAAGGHDPAGRDRGDRHLLLLRPQQRRVAGPGLHDHRLAGLP